MRTLLILMSFELVIGCSKSKTETPATTETATKSKTESQSTDDTPKLDVSGVLLEKGYCALLVTFPNVPEGSEWLSMVTLKGEKDTDKLPRIPLSSSYSVTVLNIPPGRYEVDAKAWVRKNAPYAGGISDSVTLIPGELLILNAPPTTAADGSIEGIKLLEAGRTTWGLSSPRDLSKYIADAVSSAKG